MQKEQTYHSRKYSYCTYTYVIWPILCGTSIHMYCTRYKYLQYVNMYFLLTDSHLQHSFELVYGIFGRYVSIVCSVHMNYTSFMHILHCFKVYSGSFSDTFDLSKSNSKWENNMRLIKCAAWFKIFADFNCTRIHNICMNISRRILWKVKRFSSKTCIKYVEYRI